ncbi:MAG: ABC transporter substrate-binding protein [Steroidobacteraceae bacterium]|nr:ABC transporter substrate-binding protein [Deltaproteobacteria bacterium]
MLRLISIVQLVICAALLALPTACRKPEAVRLGFVGGLSGRVADLGVAGRNGVQLAVEQRNAAGGINGRPVELVVRDDEQNPETARRVVGELIGQGIELVIGPMTSSMATAVVPLVNVSGSILLSPTVTTTELAGKDDNFLRVISVTSDYASKNARFQYEKFGARRVAAIYDTGNRSYSESWLNDFSSTFTALGGKIVLTKTFRSGQDTAFQLLAQELLLSQADTVLIIGNAVDAALICQQIRKLDQNKRIAMSEWASTERFTELAGTASEGVMVAQFLDRNDSSQRYRDFLAAYRARFRQEPGFAGVAGYDAAQVALEACAIRKKGESLKNVIIRKGSFQGLQQPLTIDRFGDADRKTFTTVILNGQYITVK